ncbi:MAG: ACP S-malonyltransferase [Dermatophilaceae bacterium]
MLVIVCPGQGSQTPGFLTPWLDLPGLRERLGAMSDAVGIDLVAHGTTSGEETIKDTAVAQPLIVAAGLLTYAALPTDEGTPGLLAGHSVGEITAVAAASALAETDAVSFVATRARGMAAASAVTPTGMSAVLGGDPDEVVSTLTSLGLTPANVNGAGQIVAAGTLEQLASLAAAPPPRTRVIPLKVAGAFHTSHMAPAVPDLEALATTLATATATVPVLSNRDGAALTDGTELLARLVSQVTNPVRWDLCMQAMRDAGATGLIELAPAGTLVGLAKRGMKGVETLAVKTPDDLDAAARMLRDHATSAQSPPTTESDAR